MVLQWPWPLTVVGQAVVDLAVVEPSSQASWMQHLQKTLPYWWFQPPWKIFLNGDHHPIKDENYKKRSNRQPVTVVLQDCLLSSNKILQLNWISPMNVSLQLGKSTTNGGFSSKPCLIRVATFTTTAWVTEVLNLSFWCHALLGGASWGSWKTGADTVFCGRAGRKHQQISAASALNLRFTMFHASCDLTWSKNDTYQWPC